MKLAHQHDQDKRRQSKLSATRNQAEASVHGTRKSLEEHGDKLDEGEKEAINKAITELEESIKEGDKDAIDAKVEALTAAAQTLGEKIYAEAQAQQQADGADAGQDSADDDVVDADFKEVKRDND